MYGSLKLSSMYHQIEQAAKRKKMRDRAQDLGRLTAYLANRSLHYGAPSDKAGAAAVTERT